MPYDGDWPRRDPVVTGIVEKLYGPVEGDVLGPSEVRIPDAAALVVGADEILVVVFPQGVPPDVLAGHRAHLKEVLGDRFMLVTGGDVQLARVRPQDWGRPAIDPTKER